MIQQFELMTCKQTIKDLFLKFDIFSTSQFLRYQSEPEYRTLTGAFCSIATMIAFFAIFTNVIVDTFTKKDIVWSLNTVEEQVDSFELHTQVRGQNKFMFGVLLAGMDLNNGPQYFDVNLTLKTRVNSIERQSIPLILEKCTPEHWNVNDEIVQTYHRMNFSNMLCPPIGSKIPLQGKYTSSAFQYAQIEVLKCTNFSKVCVDESSLKNRTFIMSFFFLNSLINPDSPQQITYYLQDRNYMYFTTAYTSQLNLFVSKFKITTDESILPYEANRQEYGAIVNNLAQVVPRQQTGGKVFANAIIRRASTTVIATRSFKKVDETLSYIGGLFGFVMIFLLLIKEYTQYSFQIDVSSHLYHEDHQNPIDSDKFNFFVFIGYLFYLFLGIFGIEPDWKIMKTFDESREEVQKQFDVRFLFERINFIQKSLRILYQEEETKFIHLNRKPTLKEAEQLRQKYRFKDKIKQKDIEITEQNIYDDNINYTGSKDKRQRKGGQNGLKEVLTQENIIKSLRNLKKKREKGHEVSKKIIENIDPHIIKIINEHDERSQSHESSIERLQTNPNNSGPLQIIEYQIQIGGDLKQGQVEHEKKTYKPNSKMISTLQADK